MDKVKQLLERSKRAERWFEKKRQAKGDLSRVQSYVRLCVDGMKPVSSDFTEWIPDKDEHWMCREIFVPTSDKTKCLVCKSSYKVERSGDGLNVYVVAFGKCDGGAPVLMFGSDMIEKMGYDPTRMSQVNQMMREFPVMFAYGGKGGITVSLSPRESVEATASDDGTYMVVSKSCSSKAKKKSEFWAFVSSGIADDGHTDSRLCGVRYSLNEIMEMDLQKNFGYSKSESKAMVLLMSNVTSVVCVMGLGQNPQASNIIVEGGILKEFVKGNTNTSRWKQDDVFPVIAKYIIGMHPGEKAENVAVGYILAVEASHGTGLSLNDAILLYKNVIKKPMRYRDVWTEASTMVKKMGVNNGK